MPVWEFVVIVALLLLVGLGFPALTLLFFQREIEKTRADMNQQLQNVVSQVNQRLDNMNHTMGQRLDHAASIFGDVQKGLGELSRAAQHMEEIGKDISSLQQILRPPQARGALGETLLEQLLRQILPTDDVWETQHRFRNGETVDAVIRLGGRLVPVDAKFPLDNFRRFLEASDEKSKKAARKAFLQDVRNRINEIARKYILPDEGTFDFALMYIPAENVYYEVIVKDEDHESLEAYAFNKRVIPVSPNTFYAYLQTIALGLRGLRIEQNAQEILGALGRLRGDVKKFQEHFDTLGQHLTNAKNKYDDAAKALERFKSGMDGIERRGEQPALQESSWQRWSESR